MTKSELLDEFMTEWAINDTDGYKASDRYGVKNLLSKTYDTAYEEGVENYKRYHQSAKEGHESIIAFEAKQQTIQEVIELAESMKTEGYSLDGEDRWNRALTALITKLEAYDESPLAGKERS
jgi:flagellar biosynthesis/type III secretory pathway protein FliH